MPIQKFGFIGVGNMASALLQGILDEGNIKPSQIYIYDPFSEKSKCFTKYGVHVADDNLDIAYNCEYIFLCVKPQIVREVLSEIAPAFLYNTKCVVSICAGITIATIQSLLRKGTPVIRVMPNTPLLVGEGMAALAASAEVPEQSLQLVQSLFDSAGKTVLVREEQLSAVTAVSGSGPAYFFKFARAAVEEAAALGLDENTAMALLAQTMVGSAKMLLQSGQTPSELIAMVTSPKGTTLAASEVFDSREYEPTIRLALRACFDRAEELANP